jgi:glycogen debranching enzyme
MTALKSDSAQGRRPDSDQHAPEVAGAPPIPAEAQGELLVLKCGAMFLCARPAGDVNADAASGEGLYRDDTRFLSELRVTFGGAKPVLLSRSVEDGHRAVVNATNPSLHDARDVEIPQETVHLRRTLVVADRLYCHLELQNYSSRPIAIPLSVTLGADFADVFEVRGVRRRPAPGTPAGVRSRRSGVTFVHEGADRCTRRTVVDVEPVAED